MIENQKALAAEQSQGPRTELNAPKLKISVGQMNLILMAVEHGFREGERGKNLQGALASVFELYEVAKTA